VFMPSRWPTLAIEPRTLPDSARSSKTIATARSRSSAGCAFRDANEPQLSQRSRPPRNPGRSDRDRSAWLGANVIATKHVRDPPLPRHDRVDPQHPPTRLGGPRAGVSVRCRVRWGEMG
jgi:hypothetical protein